MLDTLTRYIAYGLIFVAAMFAFVAVAAISVVIIIRRRSIHHLDPDPAWPTGYWQAHPYGQPTRRAQE